WEGLPSSHSQVGQWEQIGIMPNARSENRGVEINGKFYIPGGWGGESMFEAYDPSDDSWETLADLPDGRHHFMASAFDNKMYLFGGSAENAYRPETNTWMYDPETDQWTVLAEMPSPRLAGAAVTVDDQIYIVGGSSGSDEASTLRYDPSGDEWTERASRVASCGSWFSAVEL
ncbi:MAG: Kelch repeat-containing protein, partial [Anaerolineae bacterium]